MPSEAGNRSSRSRWSFVARNTNPHEPLAPPMGRSGFTEQGRQSYSIDAVNAFDPFFLELSAFCKAHELGVNTLIH